MKGPAKNSLDVDDLVDRYWHKLYKLCLFYLRDPQDAEDALQQVFEKVMRKRGQFLGQSNPYTWIYRIAVNTALNMLARRRIVRWLSLESTQAAEAQGAAAGEEDPARQLEAKQEEAERQRKLEEGIGRLSRREKEAFYLYFYERLPQREVAEAMGTSVGAVEALVHKAVKKIRSR